MFHHLIHRLFNFHPRIKDLKIDTPRFYIMKHNSNFQWLNIHNQVQQDHLLLLLFVNCNYCLNNMHTIMIFHPM